MHVTIKITPQRVMIFFIIIALWYCFIGTESDIDDPAQTTKFSDYFTSEQFFTALANPTFSSFNTNPTFPLQPINHQQRILTESSSITTKNTVLPLNAKQSQPTPSQQQSTSDSPPQIYHIKYPPIPSLVGIGPEKCGTTSMSFMLTRHPDKIPEIMKPVHEPTGVDCEMRVWLPCGNQNKQETLENVLRDGYPTKPENYCSLGWYQHFWVPHHDDIRFLHYYIHYMNSTDIFMDIVKYNDTDKTLFQIIQGKNGEYDMHNPLTWKWKYYYYFEKTPAYWCYDHVAFIFNKMLVPQGTKFFVLARDPIKRTFSYWSHQTQIGHLRGKWEGYINEGLNIPSIKSMVGLLKDESKSIMEIKDELLQYWNYYVYARDKGYGYQGRRDGSHGNHFGAKANRQNAAKKRGGKRRPLSVDMDEDMNLFGSVVEKEMKEQIMEEWRETNRNLTFMHDDFMTSNGNGTRRRLWTGRDPGYTGNADTNPKLGIGASCYVVPLLMWLEYVPVGQIALMQSELMYGGNHNNFISDVRCWTSLGYEYDTMEECRKDGKKKVEVHEEKKTGSARSRVQDSEARKLYDGLYKWCNKRLMELVAMERYKGILLHEMNFDAWYSG